MPIENGIYSAVSGETQRRSKISGRSGLLAALAMTTVGFDLIGDRLADQTAVHWPKVWPGRD